MKNNFFDQLQTLTTVSVYEGYDLLSDPEEVEGLSDNGNGIMQPGQIPMVSIRPKEFLTNIINEMNEGVLYGINKFNNKIEKVETKTEELLDGYVETYDGEKYSEVGRFLVAKNISASPMEASTKERMNDIQYFQKTMKTFDLSAYGKALYPKLGETNFYQYEELMNFIKIWGLPVATPIDYDPPLTYIDNLFMSLESFFRKVDEFQDVFSLFKALATQDYSQLEQYVFNTQQPDQSLKQHVQLLLHSKLDHVNVFSFQLSGSFFEQSIVPKTIFDSLIEASYFYLLLAIFNEADMKQCEHCSQLFEVTHKRQRFCPPLPGRKRSSCEMAYNNRLKKERNEKAHGNG